MSIKIRRAISTYLDSLTASYEPVVQLYRR